MRIINDDDENFEAVMTKEDLGIASIIVQKLLESKSVKFAAAAYDHPLKGNPVIRIKANDAKKELKKAIEAAKEEIAEFREALKKAKK